MSVGMNPDNMIQDNMNPDNINHGDSFFEVIRNANPRTILDVGAYFYRMRSISDQMLPDLLLSDFIVDAAISCTENVPKIVGALYHRLLAVDTLKSMTEDLPCEGEEAEKYDLILISDPSLASDVQLMEVLPRMGNKIIALNKN